MTTLIGDLVELAREEPGDALGRAGRAGGRRDPGRHARPSPYDDACEFDVHTEPWWVTGDPAALERAITNLLDNAAKWSPAGGTRDGRAAGRARCMVSDQGSGIAEEDLPHVFDRFYRSTESRSMPGSGLGLSIVKAVADRHGGDVRAGTGPDGGAAFWFQVPGTLAPPEVLARS